jgi:hypothetical protein
MLSKENIIKKIKSYKPCEKCNKPLPKSIPIKKLNLKNRKETCECGKRHIDDVMINVYEIIDNFGEFKSKNISLKDVGVPLVEVGYPLKYLPVLRKNELIIMANVSKECAEKIVKIDEIKGVLSINQRFSPNSSNINKLLAGDDFRCDVFPLGNDCVIVCKNQSKVHIEFPRPYNPKISKIKRLNLKNKVVIDGFCGVGTLGMIALKMEAKKVIFCDINKHAIDNLIYNLRLNFGEGIFERVEIFNADFLDLDVKGDICFVDLFPHMEPDIYLKKAKEIADEVIII